MKKFLTAIALTIAAPAFAQTAAPAPMDHSDHAAHADHMVGMDAAAHGDKMDCCEKMKAEGKKMDCCEKMDGCDKHDGKDAADAHAGHDMSNH